VEKRKKSGDTVEANTALVPWEELDEDFKDSNRHQADHRPIKARALGALLAAAGVRAPTAEHIEILARMEHRRWSAERILDGWRYAPGPKNVELKTNPTLVPWEQLPEKFKERDREVARDISPPPAA
jgi:hypothetical protein